MQLLLVRHALPLRSEYGQGSDPDLSDVGLTQAARLPAALARFTLARIVSSPQRRACHTAAPVAAVRQLPVEVDERFAEYDRELPGYVPTEQIRDVYPAEWARMLRGQLPSSVDEAGFRSRVGAAVTDLVTTAEPGQTVVVFSHGGVINVVLQEILGTARPLSFRIDYASITRLLFSRSGQVTVAGVNCTEHVWDLLPSNREKFRAEGAVVDKSDEFR
ncbi:MAG: histidine phosphatase family protein [Mycobacteriaceae bacterium]|nr:histidine phosphatase family protein [Mycobacteriaceae bacterium]